MCTFVKDCVFISEVPFQGHAALHIVGPREGCRPSPGFLPAGNARRLQQLCPAPRCPELPRAAPAPTPCVLTASRPLPSGRPWWFLPPGLLSTPVCQVASRLPLPSPATATATALPFVDTHRWRLPSVSAATCAPPADFCLVGARLLSCLGCDPHSSLSWGLIPSGVPAASSRPSAFARLPCHV